MKKGLLLVTLVALTMVGAPAFSQVTGTQHDLSATLTTGTQICVFCHTPHGSNVDAILVGRAPLWNQDLTTTASFGVYTSDTFDATDAVAITSAAYSESLLCMSCHDGTVAVGSFYNAPNPEPNPSSAGAITGSANLGTSLANDHPVNFTYASSLANEVPLGLVDPAPAGYLDGVGRVQCSSCHDPHDQAAVKDPFVNFMNNTLAGSTLCLDCHIK